MKFIIDNNSQNTWIRIPKNYSSIQNLEEGVLYLIQIDGHKFIDIFNIDDSLDDTILIPKRIKDYYELEQLEVSFLDKIDNGYLVESIEIELLTNFEGVNIQEARKQIKDKTYFINNEFFELYINGTKFLAKVSTNNPNYLDKVLKVDKHTRIKLFGKGIINISDIGGQEKLIKWYKDDYLFSLNAKALLEEWNIKTPRGLLLSGKPGLGKTFFLKAMIADSGVYYINISAPDIITPLAGDGDKILEERFEEARRNSPSVICIDEVDSLCLNRSSSNQNYENRVVTVLLKEMDGLESRGDVLVIGTTNRPEAIDKAFLRPGRFTYQIELEYPNERSRKDIFVTHLRRINHSLSENDLTFLAQKTQNYTGAEIESLVHKAAISCIRESLKNQTKPILTLHFFKNLLKL